MITFAWRTTFGPEEERELRDMLAEAAGADAEAGFPQVSLDQPYGSDASHLLVWLLADDRPGSQAAGEPALAAYLRVEPDPGGGPAAARYVVRPAFRSRGISTLLAERLGLDLAGPGWSGTGVSALRVWALGDHPAAQRMARRFAGAGVRPSRRRWQLLAPLRGSGAGDPGGPSVRPPAGLAEHAAAADLWRGTEPGDPPAAAEVVVAGDGADITGAAWFDPQSGERTEYGTSGRVISVRVRPAAPDAEQVRAALLTAAMASLRRRGLRVVVITVDAGDQDLARACRLARFMHDQTDTEYTLSALDAVPSGTSEPAGTPMAAGGAMPRKERR
jgi:mycothiol synthase